jgi:hypothetical protein
MRSVAYALLAIAILGAAVANAGPGFDSYLGRPVSELARYIGPPDATSPGVNGWPIFQWSRFGPAGQKIGAGTTVEGHWIWRGRCVLKVASRPARANPTTATTDWIVENWRFVGLGCV